MQYIIFNLHKCLNFFFCLNSENTQPSFYISVAFFYSYFFFYFSYRCDNKQLIKEEFKCDVISHCIDHSDETNCEEHRMFWRITGFRFPPPTIVNLDGKGNFTQELIKSDQVCPETHFRCHGEDFYCFPVYLR